MKLADSTKGTEWKVTRVGCKDSELQNRLYALGIYPGVEVRLLRVAPMGDPMQVRVGGTLLSIRRQEAQAIDVEPTGTQTLASAEMPEISVV